MKRIETFIKNTVVANTPAGRHCSDLAAQYGVPFIRGKAEAGCPGIMNPLGETPAIELQWGSGTHNLDKTERFLQFHKALSAMVAFDERNLDSLKNQYLELNIHGRAMFINIASKNPNSGAILSSIEDYAAEGLNREVIPYNKGGATIEQIFNQYIAPTLAQQHINEHLAATSPVNIDSLLVNSQALDQQQQDSEWVNVTGDDGKEA